LKIFKSSNLAVLLFIIFGIANICLNIDFTDEMQYYGQISSFVENNKFFVNDLFFQQLTYLYYYPVLKVFNIFFDSTYLVFFVRLILFLSICLMLFIIFKKNNSKLLVPLIVLFISIMLSISVSYQGLFSLSYNTVSQIIWILFIFNFYNWGKNSYITAPLYSSSMSIIHPPSAIAIAILCLTRLAIEPNSKSKITKYLIYLGLISLVIGLLLLSFTNIHDIKDSLSFSSSYGVGAVLISNINQLVLFSAMIITAGFSLVIGNFFKRRIIISLTIMSLILFISLQILSYIFGINPLGMNFILLSCPIIASLLFSLNFRSNQKLHSYSKILWVFAAFMFQLITISLTSGNGVFQSLGANMLIIPLLLLMSASINISKKSYYSIVFGSFLLFFSYWITYSYRDYSKLVGFSEISNIREYKNIFSSPSKKIIIDKVQNEYGNKFMDKDVLISGTWPVMYHILKAKPQTCMVYMHSVVSDEGLKLMKDCLKTKTFDYFIHIKSNIEINYPNNRLDQLNLHIIESRNLICKPKKIEFEDADVEYILFKICSKRTI